MILDYDDELTTAGGQNMDGAASIGTKVKDAGKARDWGAGQDITPYMRVTSTADSDVATSMQVDFIGADNAALTTNPVVLSTKTILKAALTKNSVHRFPPLASGSNKQFFGVKFTPAGGNQASGAKAICGLMSDPDSGAQDGVNYL
jgi:hypothetical protein